MVSHVDINECQDSIISGIPSKRNKSRSYDLIMQKNDEPLEQIVSKSKEWKSHHKYK